MFQERILSCDGYGGVYSFWAEAVRVIKMVRRRTRKRMIVVEGAILKIGISRETYGGCIYDNMVVINCN